jgi:PAS domain-containing protein
MTTEDDSDGTLDTPEAAATTRTDAHYRALFDALPLPVVISRAADGSPAYSNPAYLRLVHAPMGWYGCNIAAIVSGQQPLRSPDGPVQV